MFDHGYALLIGVDQNQKNPRLALPIVKKDITKLNEIITHPERCGYLKENVRVLTGPEATRAEILDGLYWMKKKLDEDKNPNQTAFVYYSGHGHRDSSGESFFVPYDTGFSIKAGGLAATVFAESLADIKPRRLLVILDCCHAESMEVKNTKETGLVSAAVTSDTPGVELLGEGDGRAVLSSSRDSQQSWIRSDSQMSVFTYHLVEALTGYAGRLDSPSVTVTEVMDYVGKKVPLTAMSQHNADQEPVFRYSGTAFPIALVLGGKGVAKGMTPPDPLAELPLRITSKLDVETIEGKATNVDIGEMRGGQVDATTTVKTVSKDAEAISVKIGTLGSK